MGWKGTLRSISAALRAAEREAQRRHKAALKEQVTKNSAAAVSDWEDYVDELVSIHTNLAEAIDWRGMAAKPRPEEPEQQNLHQENARAALAKFKPSLFDMFRGGTKRRRERLESNLAEASARDQAEYQDALASYHVAFEEWDSDTSLARRLVVGEAAAIKEVIEEMQSLSDHGLIGSVVSFSIDDGSVHAKPEVHTDEIVPNFRRKQLASGRLSQTKMPLGQFNELYQDYVGSVALKVAGDLFHILPIDDVYVTCVSRLLNSQTGHQELTPILSVHFVRSTFSRLNLENLDPSDSMKNFNHVMSFKKSKGFSAVEPLKLMS